MYHYTRINSEDKAFIEHNLEVPNSRYSYHNIKTHNLSHIPILSSSTSLVGNIKANKDKQTLLVEQNQGG
jgi:hypothetical protein